MLKNKVALVSGGNRGIGRAIVRELVKKAVKVVFTFNKDETSAKNLVKELKNKNLLAVQLEVRDFDAAKKVVELVKEKFGTLDILVNNAGITKDNLLMFMSKEEWADVIDVNLNGIFNLTRAAIVTFMKQKSGCIVNIASASGIIGLPGQTNYSASKAGIIGFTKSLAKEVAKLGINVNAEAPGFIDTDMLTKIPDKFKEQMFNMIPMGRIGRAEEVAQLVAYLVSDAAKYITGQVIPIDGGITA
jgi:3-oxoacyl-[acyl-carrier protein] reductase